MLILLTLLLIIVIYFGLKNRKYYRQIPTPPGKFLFGNALDFNSTSSILTSFFEYVKLYGSVVKVHVGPFNRFLLVTDYKWIEFLLTSTKHLEKSQGYKFLNSWLGTGLLVGHGPKWKRHRKILTPAFHWQILENSIPIFESCSNVLIEKLSEKIDQNTIDIYPLITLCSLDVICETIMGTKINAQNDHNSKYVHCVKEMCRIIMERSVSPLDMNDFCFKFTRNYQIQKDAIQHLHKKSLEVITQQAGKNQPNSKKTFLDLLLEAQVDKTDIREEVDTFLFAGHDTTASAISFTLFCLAQHPQIQMRVYEEQIALLRDLKASPTYQTLQNMKYLECVIKEAMRLYPSVPIIGRKLVEDLYFEKTCIPKGDTVLIFIMGMHRNPLFFPNPEEFDPERFAAVRSTFSYLPFSAGPRNCIGQKFALVEMKSIISKIIRKFVLLPDPTHNLQLVAETVLKSQNGIRVSVKLRE